MPDAEADIAPESLPDTVRSLVVDIGTSHVKVGFAGEKEPRFELVCYVGRPKRPDLMIDEKDVFICDESETKRPILNVTFPIERGVVSNWGDMEKIWHYAFYSKLKVAPEAQPVLITEKVMNTKAATARTASLLFGTFRVPALYIINEAVLSLYAAGKTSGCVLSVGEALSSATCVIEGSIVPHSICQVDYGGCDLTKFMADMLSEKGYSFKSPDELDLARDIKETTCYVASSFDTEMRRAFETSGVDLSYEMPDGCIVNISNERFRCPEALFQPKMIGNDGAGLQELACKSTFACDNAGIRDTMLSSILLSGGSTLFRGIECRLQTEVGMMSSKGTDVKVIALANRKNLPWVGGTILASLATFQHMWVTAKEYEEMGQEAIDNKNCFS